jgi:CBS domain-containing protein
MLRLRDIMTTDVLTVSPQTSLREAMELLGRHHVSGAPVISGNTLVGVVSGTDLMTFASALSGMPGELEDVADDDDSMAGLVTPQEITDERETSSAFFAEMWEDSGADVSRRMVTLDGRAWNELEEHDVSEVMTRAPLIALGPDAAVAAAAAMMSHDKVHRVLITDGDLLVGIVSALDIAQAVASYGLGSRAD